MPSLMSITLHALAHVSHSNSQQFYVINYTYAHFTDENLKFRNV